MLMENAGLKRKAGLLGKLEVTLTGVWALIVLLWLVPSAGR